MSSVNKVILIGRLGQDPETRQFQNGGMIANLSIATSEKWTDKNTGEPREQTEWHKVVLNNRLAEIAGQYLSKGSLVYIEGSIHTRKWQDQQGNDRYSTEIKGLSMQMLGGGQGQNAPQQGYPQQGQGGYPQNGGYQQQSYSQNGQGGYQTQQPQNQAPAYQRYANVEPSPHLHNQGQQQGYQAPQQGVRDDGMPF